MAAQDNAPWVLIKGGPEDRRKCGALLNACAGLCLLLAALVEPFMPSVTRKVKRALGPAFISCLHVWGISALHGFLHHLLTSQEAHLHAA